MAIKWVKLQQISKGLRRRRAEVVISGRKAGARSADGNASSSHRANPAEDADAAGTNVCLAAFRRPLNDTETAPYIAMAKARVAKRSEPAGCRAQFVSRHSDVGSIPVFGGARGRLPDHALAARLSYFLWSTMPDDELRAAADAGRLADPAVLHQQVERMLAHPKADAFIENFTGQWLNLTEIDATDARFEALPRIRRGAEVRDARRNSLFLPRLGGSRSQRQQCG